jgi:hypothetical protein
MSQRWRSRCARSDSVSGEVDRGNTAPRGLGQQGARFPANHSRGSHGRGLARSRALSIRSISGGFASRKRTARGHGYSHSHISSRRFCVARARERRFGISAKRDDAARVSVSPVSRMMRRTEMRDAPVDRRPDASRAPQRAAGVRARDCAHGGDVYCTVPCPSIRSPCECPSVPV